MLTCFVKFLKKKNAVRSEWVPRISTRVQTVPPPGRFDANHSSCENNRRNPVICVPKKLGSYLHQEMIIMGAKRERERERARANRYKALAVVLYSVIQSCMTLLRPYEL